MIDSDDPDNLMENIWFTIKCPMRKFYSTNKIRNVEIWSSILNNLKLNKQYDDIANKITKYFMIFMVDFMESYKNHEYNYNYFYGNIILKNIKRWEKESIKFKIDNNNYNNYINIVSLFRVFMSMLKISKTNDEVLLKYFINITNLLANQNYDNFIIYALSNNKPVILDSINSIVDYNIHINLVKIIPDILKYPRISFLTICKKFNNKINYIDYNNE